MTCACASLILPLLELWMVRLLSYSSQTVYSGGNIAFVTLWKM